MMNLELLISSLIILSEITLILSAIMIGLYVLHRRKHTKQCNELQAFNHHFDCGTANNKHNIFFLVKEKYVCPDTIAEQISTTIHEQQKLLASSIGFAYLNKGSTPLATVKEKIDLFISACVLVDTDEHRNLRQQVNKLNKENTELLTELNALVALKLVNRNPGKDTNADGAETVAKMEKMPS